MTMFQEAKYNRLKRPELYKFVKRPAGSKQMTRSMCGLGKLFGCGKSGLETPEKKWPFQKK